MKIWTDLTSVLSQFMRLTDRQTACSVVESIVDSRIDTAYEKYH